MCRSPCYGVRAKTTDRRIARDSSLVRPSSATVNSRRADGTTGQRGTAAGNNSTAQGRPAREEGTDRESACGGYAAIASSSAITAGICGQWNGVQRSVCTAAILSRSCPLWVKSGHRIRSASCPLYPQKRTLELSGVMSALCQKRTFRPLLGIVVGGQGCSSSWSITRETSAMLQLSNLLSP